LVTRSVIARSFPRRPLQMIGRSVDRSIDPFLELARPLAVESATY
jgi:hypothetical protein